VRPFCTPDTRGWINSLGLMDYRLCNAKYSTSKAKGKPLGDAALTLYNLALQSSAKLTWRSSNYE
jgi:hypothetical protein